MEPGKLVPVKPEVHIGPGQHNYDPRVQRPYAEELRGEVISDRCAHNQLLI